MKQDSDHENVIQSS